MFVCCVGSGLRNELTILSEEPYRVCMSNCMWYRNVKSDAAWARIGLEPQKKHTAFCRHMLVKGISYSRGRW
jgi:hypothetical protein